MTGPFFGMSLRLLLPFPNFSGQPVLLQRLSRRDPHRLAVAWVRPRGGGVQGYP
jgi:hypothetical protein